MPTSRQCHFPSSALRGPRGPRAPTGAPPDASPGTAQPWGREQGAGRPRATAGPACVRRLATCLEGGPGWRVVTRRVAPSPGRRGRVAVGDTGCPSGPAGTRSAGGCPLPRRTVGHRGDTRTRTGIPRGDHVDRLPGPSGHDASCHKWALLSTAVPPCAPSHRAAGATLLCIGIPRGLFKHGAPGCPLGLAHETFSGLCPGPPCVVSPLGDSV